MESMKSFISRYRAYLADNPNRYWFKRKPFGWGWVPATWEGWVTMLVFLLAIVGNALRIDWVPEPTDAQVLVFVVQTFVMALILIGICYVTGEEPKWQWHIPEKSDEQK